MRKDWEPVWDKKWGWKVDFYIEGERIRRSLGIRDKSLKGIADQKAKKIYRELWECRLNPVAQRAGTPFWKAASGYVEAGGEARFLPPLIRHFGEESLIEDIDEAAIVAAGVAVYPGRAPDTIRRQVRVPITAVLRWARGERRNASTDNERVRWLTPEEAEALIAAARSLTLPRHRAPEPFTLAKIAFLLGSGCRTGECFAASVADWNAPTRQLWIPATEVGAGKTRSSARWVRLPERSIVLMGELPSKGRMFRTPYGREITLRKAGGGQMQTAFNKARDLAGLGDDVTPHVLRHTWATWSYAQTLDFGTLMDQGGWSKADMANRYRKLAPDDLSERLLAHGWDFRRELLEERRKGLRVVGDE
ncbi:MAG: site-specific integrase [Pseudomonadota bacterium]